MLTLAFFFKIAQSSLPLPASSRRFCWGMVTSSDGEFGHSISSASFSVPSALQASPSGLEVSKVQTSGSGLGSGILPNLIPEPQVRNQVRTGFRRFRNWTAASLIPRPVTCFLSITKNCTQFQLLTKAHYMFPQYHKKPHFTMLSFSFSIPRSITCFHSMTKNFTSLCLVSVFQSQGPIHVSTV